MLALGIETESEETRKDMMKRLEGQKIRAALGNMREAGIKSFGFFILGYPGDTPESLERTIDYAIDLDPDFANFYPAVPYPGTELYEKAKRAGWLASEDWSRMEYSVLPDARQRPGRERSCSPPSTARSGASTCARATSIRHARRHRPADLDQVEPRLARRRQGDLRHARGGCEKVTYCSESVFVSCL